MVEVDGCKNFGGGGFVVLVVRYGVCVFVIEMRGECEVRVCLVVRAMGVSKWAGGCIFGWVFFA